MIFRKLPRRITSGFILAAVFCFAAGITAEEQPDPVGPRGEVERIRFEGVEAYSANAVRRGLLTNGKFLAASHPRAGFDAFREVLIDAVASGYRNGGFPEVAVKLAQDEDTGQLTVVVIESPRFRMGEVVIRGVDNKLATELAAHLTGENESHRSPRRAYLHRIRNYLQQATASLAPEPPAAENETGDEKKAIYPGEGGVVTTAKSDLKVVRPEEQILNYFGYPVEMPAARGRSTRGEENDFEFMPTYRKDSELWKRGEEFPFLDSTSGRWLGALRSALSEFGYRSARIELEFDRDTEKGTVDLLAHIEKLGLPAVIGTIHVEGAEINTAKKTLDYLGLKSGIPLTKAVLEEAELKLIESGRFFAHRIVLQPRSAIDTDEPVDLLLQLTECPGAPALNEEPDVRQRALLGLANWFSHLPEGGEDLVLSWDSFELDLEELGLAGRKPVELPRGRIILSPENGLLLMIGDAGKLMPKHESQPSDGKRSSLLALEFSNHANAVYAVSESGIRRWESPAYAGTIVIGISAQSNGDPPDEGPMSINFGAGFSSKRKGGSDAPILLNLFAAPVGAFYTTDQNADSLSNPEPGVLMIGEPGKQYMKVEEASGKPLEAIVGEEGLGIRIKPVPGAFEKYRRELAGIMAGAENEYNGEDSLRNLLSIAVDHGITGDLVMSQLDADDRKLVTAIARTLLEERLVEPQGEPLLSWIHNGSDKGDTFNVPISSDILLNPNQMLGALAAFTIGPVSALFPEDSWMRQLAREVLFVIAGNRDHIEALVEELTSDPAPIGPLASRIATGLLDRIGSPFADRMALKGYGLLTEEAFRRDWQPLLASDRPLSLSLLRLMEVFAELEPESDAGAGSPEQLREAIEAHRNGDHESALRLLEPAASEFWRSKFSKTLKKSYEERLGLAGIDRKSVAAVVNREPITHLDVTQALCLEAVNIEDGANNLERESAAIDQLIQRKLLYLEFLRMGGKFPPGRIEAAMERMFKQAGNGDLRLGAQKLEQIGIARNDLFLVVREVLAQSFMKQLARRPSEAALRSFFDAHPEDFVEPRAVRLHMISVEANEEGRTLIEEITKKLRGGADFAKLARAHSKDSKAAEGGDWGWVSEGSLKKEITDPAFALKPGELGEAVEFLGHYRLMKAGKQRESKPKSFEQVREELTERLAETKGGQYAREYMERLRRNAAVIPLERTGPWTAWANYEKTTASGKARGHSLKEIVTAAEGKLVDGEPRYRLRMEPNPGAEKIQLWSIGMDPAAHENSQRTMKERGLEEIYHQEFTGEKGEIRHQTIWRKVPDGN